MPRVERIEYENAIYHVMNRGRGRQTIFHGEDYYKAFEQTLSEAHQRFGLVIHAYCLMGNHYHLLLQTPRANLARIMRHVNGVYTQRYNRLKRTDGPLFRGRYKSLLVDDDVYALYVSRYIHRNPIDMKRPLVERLEQYSYSSYPAYINQAKSPEWLERDFLFGLEGSAKRYKGMQSFVEAGTDSETEELYNKQRWPRVYGGESFRKWVYDEKFKEIDAPKKAAIVTNTPSDKNILEAVRQYYNTSKKVLITPRRGKGYQNKARDVAIYLCQQVGDKKLASLAPLFGLGHVNSVSYVTSKIRKQMQTDKELRQDIEAISRLICDNVT